MKRIFLCLLLLLMLPAAAFAQDFSAPVQSATYDLTEVYGYLVEETKDFSFSVTESDTQWEVTFYPNAHPDWVYTSVIAKRDNLHIGGSTPFHVEGYIAYPGEGSIRAGLHAARENHWFTDLSPVNRAAFLGWMEQWGIPVNDALRQGLTNGSATPPQLISEYFRSCYGDPANWPQALLEWRDEVLAFYSFTMADVQSAGIQTVPVPETKYVPGIRQYQSQSPSGRRQITVTEFAGEVPGDLSQALSHPKLAGYTCICGAYIQSEPTDNPNEYETGLLALQKGDERLLVCLRRAAGTSDWAVTPVGGKALLPTGDVYITYAETDGLYEITYPLPDTETQQFRVRMMHYANIGPLCALEEYRRTDTATGERITIAAADSREVAADDGEWYHVTTTNADGKTITEQIHALAAPYLDYIDADAFPKTAEACRAATGYTLPDGYAVACNVHLRAKTSSHSADLGIYHYGTLMEVLGTEPGNPFQWYHVRIGSAEGYMAAIYVDYPGSECVMKPLQKFPPLPVAKTVKEIQLKQGTSLFAAAVTSLPAGAKMHVLAENGGWLHVMVPRNGNPGWLMDIHGTDGYVKAKDLVTAATSQQLDWME